MISSHREKQFKIFVPFVTLFFLFAMGELFFRIKGYFPSYLEFSNEQFYQLKETTRVKYPPSREFFNVRCLEREPLSDKNYQVMGLDLREYDYSIRKPADATRIMGLGDSFAWGWGIFDNRQTMFKLLECWLNIMKNQQGSIEVINCAQPGGGIDTYFDFMNKDGFALEPDIVLLVFNLNDISCYHASVPVEANAFRMFQKDPGWLSSLSKLYAFFRFRYMFYKASEFTLKDYRDSYFGPKKKLWEITQTKLITLNRQCKERGIRLITVIFPLLNNLEGTYPFDDVVSEIEGFLKQNNLEYINLLPGFRGKESRLLWVLPADAHPNEIAHRIAAETLYYTLKERNVIDLHDWNR